MRAKPIKDKRVIWDIIDLLEGMEGDRARRVLAMFVVGINQGLRISDLTQLRIGMLRGKSFDISEQKTGRKKDKEKNVVAHITRTFPVTVETRRFIREHFPDAPDDQYLLQSPIPSITGAPKPISTKTAYNDMQWIAGMMGLKELGTHTLRKTFGYHHFRETKDIGTLQTYFGHTNQNTTKIYIGVELEDLDKYANKVSFMRPKG